LTFGDFREIGRQFGSGSPGTGQILGLYPRFAIEKEIAGIIEEEIPIGVDDVLKSGTRYRRENRFAFDEKQYGGRGANEDKRRLRIDGNCLHMGICVCNAGGHADTITDVSSRNVFVRNIEVVSSRFPSLDATQEAAMQQRVRQEGVSDDRCDISRRKA